MKSRHGQSVTLMITCVAISMRAEAISYDPSGDFSVSITCGGYYSPSTNMIVSNTFAYPDARTLTNLVWSPILPNTNWTLVSAAGDGDPSVVGSNITFAVPPTNRPVSFTYTVMVPGNQAVSNVVNAGISYAYDGGLTRTSSSGPLTIFRYHSSDYRLPHWKIDTNEMTRALAYWRGGRYRPNLAMPDGYEETTNAYAGRNSGRHSADYLSPAWKIKVVEIARVLNYWRSGGYHVDLSQPDGYNAGTNGPGPL